MERSKSMLVSRGRGGLARSVQTKRKREMVIFSAGLCLPKIIHGNFLITSTFITNLVNLWKFIL